MTDHTHKLRRGQYKTGTTYFKCVDCSFQVVSGQAVGRESLCWRCHKPFRMTKNDTKWAKPVCIDCRNGPSKKIDLTKLDSFIDDLIK